MKLEELADKVNEGLNGFSLDDFEVLEEYGGERHGSWEWRWVGPRQQKGRGRVYVSLSAFKSGNDYQIEVWAGADDGIRFRRDRVDEPIPVQQD